MLEILGRRERNKRRHSPQRRCLFLSPIGRPDWRKKQAVWKDSQYTAHLSLFTIHMVYDRETGFLPARE